MSLRQMAVVPLLPQFRIGEALGVSELKGGIASGGTALRRPILVSFADQAENHAGIGGISAKARAERC